MKTAIAILLLPLLVVYNTSYNTNWVVAKPEPVKTAAPDTLVSPKKIAEQNFFGRVLDVSPPTIVGNFGEPRRLHFHTGLDFRTNQEEGHTVFAAGDEIGRASCRER